MILSDRVRQGNECELTSRTSITVSADINTTKKKKTFSAKNRKMKTKKRIKDEPNKHVF